MPSPKLLWLLPLLVLSACGTGNIDAEIKSYSPAATETSADSSVSASAGRPSKPDERKLIRTADMEVHVPDVLAAVTRLEKCVKGVGGTIEESHISNNAETAKMVEYKADSLKEVKVCHTTAELKLRVPVTLLDSVVNSVPGGAIYVENRRLSQYDVTGRYMTNELMNKPGDLHTTTKALQVAENAEDALDVQRYADDRKEEMIRRHVENQDLLRNIEYATLTVRFTQAGTVFSQVVADPEYAATVPFATELGTAARNGSQLLQGLLLVLVNIWPLLLIASVAFSIVLYIRWHRNVPVQR